MDDIIYTDGNEVPELFTYGEVEEKQQCDDDPIEVEIIKDSSGTQFDPDIHKGVDIKTKGGKFKKLSKAQLNADPSDIKISSDFLLAFAKQFGSAISGNEEFKIKSNKQLDTLFTKTLDEKMATQNVVETMESKLPYLIIIGVPLFYIYQGLQKNEPLHKKVKISLVKNSIKPYFFIKEKLKNIFGKKNKKKSKKELADIDKNIATQETNNEKG